MRALENIRYQGPEQAGPMLVKRSLLDMLDPEGTPDRERDATMASVLSAIGAPGFESGVMAEPMIAPPNPALEPVDSAPAMSGAAPEMLAGMSDPGAQPVAQPRGFMSKLGGALTRILPHAGDFLNGMGAASQQADPFAAAGAGYQGTQRDPFKIMKALREMEESQLGMEETRGKIAKTKVDVANTEAQTSKTRKETEQMDDELAIKQMGAESQEALRIYQGEYQNAMAEYTRARSDRAKGLQQSEVEAMNALAADRRASAATKQYLLKHYNPAQVSKILADVDHAKAQTAESRQRTALMPEQEQRRKREGQIRIVGELARINQILTNPKADLAAKKSAMTVLNKIATIRSAALSPQEAQVQIDQYLSALQLVDPDTAGIFLDSEDEDDE